MATMNKLGLIALNYYNCESEFVQARKCCEVIRKHGKQGVIRTDIAETVEMPRSGLYKITADDLH